MAGMTTTLDVQSLNGMNVIYTAPTSTAARPHTVEQKRKLPQGQRTVNEAWLNVKRISEDPDGNALPTPVILGIYVRHDVNCLAADKTAVKTLFREIVASDEFDVLVDSQKPFVAI